MPKTVVIDTSDLEKRKKNVDPDWIQRVQYNETGKEIRYLSGSKEQQYIVKLWKDESGNYLGSCSCPWIGRQKEGSVSTPCKHLVAAFLLEDPLYMSAVKITQESPKEALDEKYEEDAYRGDGIETENQPESTEGASRDATDTPDTPKADEDTQEAEKAAQSVESTPKREQEDKQPQKAEETPILDPPIIPRWNPQDVVTIWPSSVPMLEACSASRVIDSEEILIDRVGAPALVGRAAHELCESLVSNEWKYPDEQEVFSIAVKNHVIDYAEDLKFLGIFAAQAWHGNEHFEGVRRWFNTPNVEERIRWEFKFTHQFKKDKKVLIKVSGRLDVCETFPEEERAVVLDWKSGWKNEEDDYEAQMMMGAALLMSRDKRINTVTTILVWLKDRQMHNVTYTRQEIKDWLNELIKYNIFWDGQTYGPGRACTYCKKMMVCEARRAMIEQTARSLVVQEGDELITPIIDENGYLIPERAYRAYQHVTILKKTAEEFLAQFKERIAEGGPMPIPGGEKEMSLVEFKGREKIDPLIAWPIMRKFLRTDEAISGCISVSTTELKSAVAEATTEGTKKAAIEECWKELEASGALSRGQPSMRLKATKIKPDNAIEA